jgi:glycosyltransferase involved in cell wall biosynthesis
MSMIADPSTRISVREAAQPRQLRVLFINDTSRNGGPGRTILYITKFLNPARVRRTILIPREGIVSRRLADAGAAEEIFFERGLIENLFEPLSRPIARNDFDAPLPLKIGRAAGNVALGIAGFVRLLRRARKERFDLIFCNGTSAGFLGGALAAATGIPAVWHVLYPSVPSAVRGLHQRLAASKAVRSIICVSRHTSLQFAHCSQKVHRIQTALDIDEFDSNAAAPALRTELGLGADTVIFGSHGRILPRKGFIELIRAARIVVDKLEPVDRMRCRFVILGDTPQDMRPDHLEECRTLVRQLNLTDQVLFIGFRPDVRPYVADFDVSIVPSVYEDPLPRAVMESMAMSKPVVAFAMGGIAEMIDDRVEGRLARGRPPDIETLAAACLDYFFDPGMRQRHSIAARKRIERDFDARKHARILQDEMFRIVNTFA